MAFPHTFAARSGAIPTSELDANFAALEDTGESNKGAGLVKFLQAGTSAQPRTAQSKMRDVVSVKDFGAVGNGSADDTAAIQAALNAAARVLIPTGTYRITADLTLASNRTLFGEGPTSILKAATTSINLLKSIDTDYVSLSNFAIDGGGQTTDVFSGVANVIGVRFEGTRYFTIDRLFVSKCGVANAISPTSDASLGGFGILVMASTTRGAEMGVISRCVVSEIAGGGDFRGDGITITGAFSGSAGRITRQISVRDCQVFTVARHCYSVAGETPYSLPRDIQFSNCVGVGAALCGIDLEDSSDVVMSACTFRLCGGDTTYFDPVAAYGATYRLLAGIATGNDGGNNQIVNCHMVGCYYGVTYGGASVTVSDTRVESSTTSDIGQGLALTPSQLTISNCTFDSTASTLNLVSGNTQPGEVFNSVFAAEVRLTNATDVGFIGCTFKRGVKWYGSGGARMNFQNCIWTDFSGEAISHNGISYQIADVSIDQCQFLGTGNMTNGVSLLFNSALRWSITNCLFSGLTGSGITLTNGNNAVNFGIVSGNKFRSCANGVVISASGNQNGQFCNNYFESITGWALDFSDISTGTTFNQNQIIGNLAGASVANGFRVGVTTGSWDWCVNVGNNWHNATTKTSLSAGNANGQTANNITT